MIEVLAEKGYAAASIADVVRAAGTSRNTFYRHFAGKQDCACSAVDAIVDLTATRMVDAYRGRRGDYVVRLGGTLETLIDLVIRHPAEAKVLCVEVHAIGPEAIRRGARLDQLLERLVTHALERSPERIASVEPRVVQGVIGGIRQIVHSRVRVGREHELLRLGPEMLEWALTYVEVDDGPRGSVGMDGHPVPTPGPPIPAAQDARERMLFAVAELTLAKGIGAMTITEIANRGRVSLTTFYNHFSTKEDALLAAAAHGEKLILERTLPAYQAAPSWPLAVRDGLHTFLGFLTANPAFARLGLVGVYSGGPSALEWRETSVARFQALMAPGYDEHPQAPRIAAEAVGSVIASLLYDLLLARDHRQPMALAPLTTFMALTPFVGSAAASLLAAPASDP